MSVWLNVLLLAFIFTQAGGHSSHAASPVKERRNILQFGRLIECVVGIYPLEYNGYGCYCGMGGHGRPVDKTDWCCHAHDCCYGKAIKAGCNPYMKYYNYECNSMQATCSQQNDECAKLVCECDLQAARCFRSAQFDNNFVAWPNENCHGATPACP
ncbi:neutral phospholipase A2 3-like [Lethenteron reissneri]|uniref:neutral phospholipase A2 3-like n=1 Tax=Lethenteron reissneri TaxID=7753 RepID=UPI002AB657C9|nr:neutral phospholipase A2 3-like [Lethenteron reissneri]